MRELVKIRKVYDHLRKLAPKDRDSALATQLEKIGYIKRSPELNRLRKFLSGDLSLLTTRVLAGHEIQVTEDSNKITFEWTHDPDAAKSKKLIENIEANNPFLTYLKKQKDK